MDQQSSVSQQAQSPFVNQPQQDFEQGEVVEIKQKIQKAKINKNNRCEIDGSDSEWSWDSIEDLKGVDLKHLQAQEEQGGKIQPQHKQKHKLKVIFPQKPKNIENLTTKNVGKVIQVVGDLLIVETNLKQTYEVVDLDGWVCDNNKNFIGFVIDVFGKIETPFYAIKPEENLQNLTEFIGKQIFYIEGTKTLKEDQIKSIQSKNNKEFQIEDGSSQSDYEKEEKQMSVEAPEIYNSHREENLVQNRRNRKKSFDHGERNTERSRTRDHFKNRNWNIRQNNQQYLQNMYAMHYNQMMQFYHPNYQANTATFPTMPPPPFGNPPNFVQGNMPPQYGQGNQHQQVRPNSFIPPTNYQNQNGYQNQGNHQNQRR